MTQRCMFRQDDSCHWYLVPEAECRRFDELCALITGELEPDSEEWFDAICEFDNSYGHLRCGHPSNYVITAN